MDYLEFLKRKANEGADHGFSPTFMPGFLFDFQAAMVEWAVVKGRAALFEDCGMGKTAQFLVWAQNVVEHTNKPVLVLTPLAVSMQTTREAEKFGVEAVRSHDGQALGKIVVTNYEKLHLFNWQDFSGVVCDECFPRNTEIDVLSIDGRMSKKYIQDIQKGDKIINAFGVDIVSDIHRREVGYAVKVKTPRGDITSSPNHPYFTQRGWVGAVDLRPGDSLMETTEGMRLVQDRVYPEIHSGEESNILRSILFSELADDPARGSGEGAFNGSCMQEGGKEGGMVQNARRGKGVGPDPGAQPNEQPGDQGKSEPPIESREAQTFRAWGQWERIDRTSAEALGCSVRRLDSGISFVTGRIETGVSDALQTGLGETRQETRNRGGWSLTPEQEAARREKRCHAGFVGVDGVEVLELGHPDLAELRDAEGKLYFYDLGATRHPSYSVNGFLVHNSSILKSFDGARKQEITDFMKKVPYRLLCTATAAPNDYFELGTSSEALGYLGFMDMMGRFFKNDNNNTGMRRMYGEAPKWRFKGHAEIPFWQWVCSWARALRKPSDLGFDDKTFLLPPLIENEHLVDSDKVAEGMLFTIPATSLPEQREERKRTIEDRCQKVVELVNHDQPAIAWCHLNDEGDMLAKTIPGAVQISGSDKDEAKEEKFLGFIDGHYRVLVTKPKIGAHGLNFQHCNHAVAFPSHSFEQYYQLVRRCWRFGQKRPVTVDVVLTEGERRVMENLKRKANAADKMFDNLVREMNNAVGISKINNHIKQQERVSWL